MARCCSSSSPGRLGNAAPDSVRMVHVLRGGKNASLNSNDVAAELGYRRRLIMAIECMASEPNRIANAASAHGSSDGTAVMEPPGIVIVLAAALLPEVGSLVPAGAFTEAVLTMLPLALPDIVAGTV